MTFEKRFRRLSGRVYSGEGPEDKGTLAHRCDAGAMPPLTAATLDALPT